MTLISGILEALVAASAPAELLSTALDDTLFGGGAEGVCVGYKLIIATDNNDINLYNIKSKMSELLRVQEFADVE